MWIWCRDGAYVCLEIVYEVFVTTYSLLNVPYNEHEHTSEILKEPRYKNHIRKKHQRHNEMKIFG
jgi:hypothetical protein